MDSDEKLTKFPQLRDDIKISKIVRKENISYIIKDPLKDSFMRFDKEEWEIMSLFNGERTLEEIVKQFNETHLGDEVDVDLVKDYKESMESMNLLKKSQQEQNIMLIEKMKEMRKSQLLSKKGSLLYKRFPIVDPDKFFDKIIPKITFFWTKPFILVSSTIMLLAVIIIIYRFREFNMGMYEIFNFSSMSFWNIAILWTVIYIVIAIHEVGHGLTCKYYGGEVHEIGFLFLFFQPCMYCNVNDAWLFDKKWKQVMVTIAGGYIEFFIGAIFTIIWALSNPNTFLNVISFQIMTICSVSTVLFNFNPLIKLDGYYLLSDFVEVPNLKEDCFTYLKHVISTKVFRLPATEELSFTEREKRILFCYSLGSFCWMFALLTGIFGMVKGLLVDNFQELGLIVSLFLGYKIFWGYIEKSGKFLLKVYLHHKEFFCQRPVKSLLATLGVCIILAMIIPIPYRIYGKCTLEPSFVRVVRAITSGQIIEFKSHDGKIVKPGEQLLTMKSMIAHSEREMASLEVEKAEIQLRKTLINNPDKIPGTIRELDFKQAKLDEKRKRERALTLVYSDSGGPIAGESALLSCKDEINNISKRFKEGEEICRLFGVDKLKAILNISEQQVRFLELGDEVNFKLQASPFKTYEGKINKIRQLSTADPKNPKAKLYQAEIVINNFKDNERGKLRPGMEGIAKIIARPISLAQYAVIKLAETLRMDLFF